MPVNNPFTDPTAKNSQVIPQGAYAFIPIALKQTSTGSIVPLDVGWMVVGTSIVALEDPDTNPLSWATNAIDSAGMPDGTTDTYDADHSSYAGRLIGFTVSDGATTSGSAVVTSATAAFVAGMKGMGVSGAGIPSGTTIQSVDSATQVTLDANATATATGVTLTFGTGTEFTGLFVQLDGSTNTPERLALKVKVPSGAEKTHNNSDRSYEVNWSLRKGGVNNAVTETFNIGDAAIPVFSDIVVIWDEVTAVVTSSITDTDQQNLIINEAAEAIRAVIEDCGHDPDDLPATTSNRSIKQSILIYARALLMTYDTSAGLKPTRVKEAFDEIHFGGRSSRDLESMFSMAENRIREWCKRNSAAAAFSYGAITHDTVVD